MLDSLGKFKRPVLAAGVTLAAVAGLKVASILVEEEKAKFLAAHPDAQAAETINATLAGIPVIGGLVSAVVHPVVAAANPDSAKVLAYDDTLSHLALAGTSAAILGGVVTLYFFIRDVIAPPKPRALPTVGVQTPVGIGATVVPPTVAEQAAALPPPGGSP